jgi:hypothetical protein
VRARFHRGLHFGLLGGVMRAMLTVAFWCLNAQDEVVECLFAVVS